MRTSSTGRVSEAKHRPIRNCTSCLFSQPNSIRGFTLIELLVVLVIISLVAAFVGPRMAGSMSNLNLKTASKKIAASLRYARSQATSENTAYVVLFDLDRDRLTIRAGQVATHGDKERDGVDGSRNGGQSKSYDLPQQVRLEKGISADGQIDSGLFQIIFFSNGGSSGGEVFLRNDRGNRYRVKVDFITGTVRLGSKET